MITALVFAAGLAVGVIAGLVLALQAGRVE